MFLTHLVLAAEVSSKAVGLRPGEEVTCAFIPSYPPGEPSGWRVAAGGGAFSGRSLIIL